MIMSVEELKTFVQTDEDEALLKNKLSALELMIRAYTNNNFQVRAFRTMADAEGTVLVTSSAVPFAAGDTLQITNSDYMPDALVTVKAVDQNIISVNEMLFNEPRVMITKVVYPSDVRAGVANMINWELENRDKVGIASETISRHAVTYFDMGGENAVMGYPKALMGFLLPYVKARF